MRAGQFMPSSIGAPMSTTYMPANEHFLSVPEHQEMQHMGKRIEALRLARNWSQSEAARELGIKQPSLSLIESGTTKSINGKTMAMLCRVFQTTAEYVWFGEGVQPDAAQPALEAELVHMVRALSPEMRQVALSSVRGILNGQSGRLGAEGKSVSAVKRIGDQLTAALGHRPLQEKQNVEDSPTTGDRKSQRN